MPRVPNRAWQGPLSLRFSLLHRLQNRRRRRSKANVGTSADTDHRVAALLGAGDRKDTRRNDNGVSDEIRRQFLAHVRFVSAGLLRDDFDICPQGHVAHRHAETLFRQALEQRGIAVRCWVRMSDAVLQPTCWRRRSFVFGPCRFVEGGLASSHDAPRGTTARSPSVRPYASLL